MLISHEIAPSIHPLHGGTERPPESGLSRRRTWGATTVVMPNVVQKHVGLCERR